MNNKSVEERRCYESTNMTLRWRYQTKHGILYMMTYCLLLLRDIQSNSGHLKIFYSFVMEENCKYYKSQCCHSLQVCVF
jgi:hypothetical protein